MQEIQQKVSKILEHNLEILPHSLRDEVGATMHETLAALPAEFCCTIPLENFHPLWDEMSAWENALFFVQTPGFVIDMNGKLPGIMMGKGNMPTIDWRNGLDAHIMLDQLGSIWMVNKPLFRRESLSIHFCTKKGDHMFAVYGGRGKDRQIIDNVYASYQKIWNCYSPQPFVAHKITL